MIGDDFKIIRDEQSVTSRHITAMTSGLVCSTKIDFDLIDGKLYNLQYEKGCQGNLCAISRLLEGMETEKIISILKGVDCHNRGTSCSDQLTRILLSII